MNGFAGWWMPALLAVLVFACAGTDDDDDNDVDDEAADDVTDADDDDAPPNGPFEQCVAWYMQCAEQPSYSAEEYCRWIKLYDLNDACFATAIENYLICLQQLDCATMTYGDTASCYETVQSALSDCYL